MDEVGDADRIPHCCSVSRGVCGRGRVTAVSPGAYGEERSAKGDQVVVGVMVEERGGGQVCLGQDVDIRCCRGKQVLKPMKGQFGFDTWRSLGWPEFHSGVCWEVRWRESDFLKERQGGSSISSPCLFVFKVG